METEELPHVVAEPGSPDATAHHPVLQSLYPAGRHCMNTRCKRILVLHANEQVLMNLERLLEENGFDTTTTWDMRDALHRLGQSHYDLLVIGEHPPAVDTAAILRQLHGKGLETPTVVLLPELYPFEPEYFYSLGASEVIADWQYKDVIEHALARFAARARAVGADA
jgi:DNA-binding NarL/FixJ family response regulator